MMRPALIPIVDGATPGPDGLPLSGFARFAQRVMAGGTLEQDFAELVALQAPEGAPAEKSGVPRGT